MQPELLVCVSQEDNTSPYRFKMTGVHVYTFEEALYHTYHYWKQSIDDFTSDEFILWVNDTLNLSFLGAELKAIQTVSDFSRRLTAFLSVIDYFDRQQLDALAVELREWEKRLEWEKLKERADYLVQKGESGKAVMLYKKALTYGENQPLLNNTAIAFMQLEVYDEAERYLSMAADLDDRKLPVLLNLAEACIYNSHFEKAESVLRRVDSLSPQNSDVAYLYGELLFLSGQTNDAIHCYETAIELTPEPHYIYKLADVYVKMRLYDQALEIINQVSDRDKDFLVKQAEIFVHANNVPAAIKSIERALLYHKENVDLWTRLAMYHRLDYDLNRAQGAITRALGLDPDDDRAKLESARIKKAMGKTKDYQQILNRVLKGFKRKYRETFAE